MRICSIGKYGIVGLLFCVFPVLINAQNKGVEIIPNEVKQRVDVIIDGQPFTSYIWAENLKKPVLYPIRASSGTIITRGFPLEPRPGESIDHPHQIGFWFNYGDVNGVDFWNNSVYRKPEETAKMGTIAHRRILKTKSGKQLGELEIEADWIMPDGKQILREKTKFIFRSRSSDGGRTIDRMTTLTALGEKVVFNDSKEGLIGLRMRRELEQPTKQPILLTDANGKPMEKPVLDNTNVSGEFLSSEGKTGDEVWGTRGKWAALVGKIEQKPVTLVLFDHPKNTGFPTYWMARGYGLFAANPLGQKAFSTEKKESNVRELKFTLEPKKSVTFRYRLSIFSKKMTPNQIEMEYQNFIKRVR